MDPGSILLLISILVIVGFFVARPLIEQRATTVTAEEQNLSALMAERDRLLDAIQELDFDFNLGKIPESDYPHRRTEMLQRGADILKEIDAFQRENPVVDPVEVALVARRESLPEPARRQPVFEDDDIETLIANRRRDRQEQSAGFCPQCGQAIQSSDKFCSRCGTEVV